MQNLRKGLEKTIRHFNRKIENEGDRVHGRERRHRANEWTDLWNEDVKPGLTEEELKVHATGGDDCVGKEDYTDAGGGGGGGGGEDLENYCDWNHDSILCWPKALRGTTAYLQCFEEFNGVRYDSSQNVTRQCFENGTWSRSNYTMCLNIEEPLLDLDYEDGISEITPILYYVGYSVSVVALIFAMFIFLYFKELRCLRNTIHTNLMFTYVMADSTWILTGLLQSVLPMHVIMCVCLPLLLHYFHVTTFFWMFVEGLYLYLLVVETFNRGKIKTFVYIIIGWGIPLVLIIAWATFKALMPMIPETVSDEFTAHILSQCHWMNGTVHDWVFKVPILVVMALNSVFLVMIMWVLITKLRSANNVETQQYRKATKALLILIPLLGITYILTIVSPTEGLVAQIFYNMRAFLLSFQGFFVALFYCFLNSEVQNTIRHHWNQWRTARTLGDTRYNYSRDWSPRSRTESMSFTAPVSEQLPSIQPPPAHSSSSSLLDQSHLMVEHQNHAFIGMTNVFDARDQGSYKSSEPPPPPPPPPHYPDEANMMLSNGNYLSSHMQDIPVINLDDNNLEKSSSNILTHEINMEDFSSYQENEPGSLEPEENDCPMSVEDEDQEEKKKLKKLGVGYRCDINGCKVRLQSEKNIQYHRRCHEGTLYNCPECCKDCSTWVSLSSHLWQAHKIDMELYKCDQCPYKTPSYSRLTNIHRGIHGKARPFLCDICGKGFKTVKQMRNHKNIHKAKMVRMSVCHCEICGRTVADKRQLELHINNTHKKKKPYLCYMCGYASAVKHSLVVHMRRHTGEKPYACEKCDYKTADHNALRRHKMKHSGVRNYKCNHCSYTCIQASTYKVHIKTKHPGLETDVIFSCGQCNFQTLNRGSFLSHTSEHENFNGQIRKTGSRGCSNSKPEMTSNGDYYGEANRMDLVGPIISERVVETIVDLSGAQTLLEQDDYYDVERITGDLDEGQELKFKTSGIT